MKIKSFLLTLISCCLICNLSGQSIPSYWMNVYQLENFYESRSGGIKKIIADKKGYYSDGQPYNEKWIYNFIESNKVQGEFYKSNELKSRFIYEFDSLKRLTKNIIETKAPLVGWQKETYTFEYVGNNRAIERHHDANNNFLRLVKYEYDVLGRPTKLQIFNSNEELESYETADYQDNYKYTYKVFSATGDLILQKINFSNIDTSSNLLNENGDLIKHVWPTASPDNNTLYLLTYKYDSNKNWTKRDVEIESRSKRSKQSIVKRKITYFKK